MISRKMDLFTKQFSVLEEIFDRLVRKNNLIDTVRQLFIKLFPLNLLQLTNVLVLVLIIILL